MIIPASTPVILATYVAGAENPVTQPHAAYRYLGLHAGKLVRNFAFERGTIIEIDGPLGGTIPTREVAFTPILYEERVIGVEFCLPCPGGAYKLLPYTALRHVMMVEPFNHPRPIPPRLAWPEHLPWTREKALTLAIALKERYVYALCTNI